MDVEKLHEPLFPETGEWYEIGNHQETGSLSSRCTAGISGDYLYRTSSSVFATEGGLIQGTRESFNYYREIPASGPGREVGTAYEATVWPGFAFAVVPCAWQGSEARETVLTVGIAANHPSDPEESERILGDLIVPYTDAIMNEISACEWPEEWEGAR